MPLACCVPRELLRSWRIYCSNLYNLPREEDGCSCTMVIDRRKIALFGTAAILRLALFGAFPSLPDLLTGRVEISTPVTSFKRCTVLTLLYTSRLASLILSIVQEGLFLHTHGVSPYDGGVFYQVLQFPKWLQSLQAEYWD